jgi:hypothetical protein
MRFIYFLAICVAAAWPIHAQTTAATTETGDQPPSVESILRGKTAEAPPADLSLSKREVGDSKGNPHRFTTTTKLWIASSLAVYAAAALDMHATEETAERVRRVHRQYPFFQLDYSFEGDPLARPFVKLPAPAYYACGAAFATGVNWLSFRMSRSKRFHKIWWLPQAFSIAGNTHGFMTYQ